MMFIELTKVYQSGVEFFQAIGGTFVPGGRRAPPASITRYFILYVKFMHLTHFEVVFDQNHSKLLYAERGRVDLTVIMWFLRGFRLVNQ